MLTHDQIWGALDRLAARAGLSPSGLAKRKGLDPTTFNRSRRVTSEGRARQAFMPIYRDGDMSLVSLDTGIRGGDRVLLKTTAGELVVATIERRSAPGLELLPLGATHSERRLAAGEVASAAKIIWARQAPFISRAGSRGVRVPTSLRLRTSLA